MYGFYFVVELWRLRLFFFILVFFVVLLVYEKILKWGWIWLVFVNIYFFFVVLFFYGGVFGLEVVEIYKWGGLLVILIIVLVGIIVLLLIGVVLVLGCCFDMFIICSLCIVYIEVWCGVFLIIVFFMVLVMLLFFLF